MTTERPPGNPKLEEAAQQMVEIERRLQEPTLSSQKKYELLGPYNSAYADYLNANSPKRTEPRSLEDQWHSLKGAITALFGLSQ